MKKFLPYGRQTIDDDDIDAVVATLKSDFLTTGPTIAAFENALAARLDVARAVVCSNGTAALHLAAMAAELGPGAKAIVPAVTFVATANAVRMTGAEVVFADVNPDNGLMEAEHLEKAVEGAGSGTKAVFPVHLAGQCGDMEAISALARDAGLTVISDACHALGGSYSADKDRPLGDCQLEDMACFSFHPVKSITMGEGGAIATSDEALAERMISLRNHGLTHDANSFTQSDDAFNAQGAPNPWYYELREVGFNYRATDFQCALGLTQLQKLSGFIERRRQLADQYDRLLRPLAPNVRPLTRSPNCLSAWHIYVVLIDFAGLGIERGAVMNGLKDQGIGTQVHYIPVTRQPYYRGRLDGAEFPGAEAYYERALTVPLFPGMEDQDPARVVKALVSVLGL